MMQEFCKTSIGKEFLFKLNERYYVIKAHSILVLM